MSDTVKVIDIDGALNRAMGDASFLQSMFDEFKRMIPDFFNRIQGDIENGNMEQLRKDAHQLKGTAANLGAEAISAASLDLETIAKSDQAQNAPQSFSRLKTAVETFHQQLAQIDWDSLGNG